MGEWWALASSIAAALFLWGAGYWSGRKRGAQILGNDLAAAVQTNDEIRVLERLAKRAAGMVQHG